MNLLNQSAFLKALGWSLLDSLWQMGLLWLVYVVLTANGRKLLSRQRHTIALLSLAGGSLWFLVTLVINFYRAAMGPEVITVFISGHDLSHTEPAPARWFEPALPWLSLAYLGAIGFLFIRFYHQYRHTQRLFTEGLKRTDPEWRAFLQEVAGRLGIKKKVQIWLSSVIDTPVTLGFLKPVILLPIAAVNHLSMPQAEAIILHELNHIRRNDYLVNLLIACVDVLFFFNPFSKLLTATIRKEREHCCDDLVLQFRYDAQAYARALLNLEQNRVATGALVVAATGKDKQLLLNRVKRILGKEPVCTPVNHKLVAYLLIAFLIGFIGWYNPGKVIVKKIETARAQVAFPEVDFAFATPAAETIIPIKAVAVPRPRPARDTCAIQEPVRKDPFEKLEQLIELTTDARLAALSSDMEDLPNQMISFVDNVEPIDFSIPDNQTRMVITTSPAPALFPYVPGNSFLYQTMEDTTLPKKYVMTAGDQKAKEAMEKALKALKQINWQKLELDLKAQGQKLDMAKVQRELEKAMQDIDWSKINTEVQQAHDMTEELVKQGDDYMVLLNHYQKERSMRQEKLKQAQQQILMDRLEHHEQLKKMEETRKTDCNKTVIKKKKIVQI